MIPTIDWQDDHVVMIDQRKLPFKESYVVCKTPTQVVEAIRKMVIRGAPAIGIAAAMGLALGGRRIKAQNRATFERHFQRICEKMASARPTASNLFWAIDSMLEVLKKHPQASVEELKDLLRRKADHLLAADQAINKAIGHHGQIVVRTGQPCSPIAMPALWPTAGYGTALGVVRAAWEVGKNIRVLADETRPFFAGAAGSQLGNCSRIISR